MRKSLIFSALAILSAGLIPVAAGVAAAPSAGATTMTHPGPIFGQVTGTPGDYSCFGAKATITDARKTFYMDYVFTYGTDANGDDTETMSDTKQPFYGGPRQINVDGRHKGIANVYYGTAGDDVIIGTSGMDDIYGGGGHDKICSLDGNDIINAELNRTGWVQVDGGRGDDRIAGSTDYACCINGSSYPMGGTSLRAYGGPGNDFIVGGSGDDYLDGGSGQNMINGGDVDSAFNDTGGSDQCFSGKAGSLNPNYVTDPTWRATPETKANYNRWYDISLHNRYVPVDFNCEQNSAGRGWTNHAMFYPTVPATTATTTRGTVTSQPPVTTTTQLPVTTTTR